MRAIKGRLVQLFGVLLALLISTAGPNSLNPELFISAKDSLRAEGGLLKAIAVAGSVSQAIKSRLTETYCKLPLSFEANRGQFDPQVKFISRGSGYTLFMTTNEAVLGLSSGAKRSPSKTIASQSLESITAFQTEKNSSVLRMRFVGSNSAPRLIADDEQPGKSNYFIGNDPKKWRTNVPNYAKVRYEEVYPGIDLVYYGNQRRLEYDFIVSPGARPDLINLEFIGATQMRVDSQGDLVIETGAGEVRQQRPIVYQEINGIRNEINATYVRGAGNLIRFEVGDYDTSKPLIIDPIISYSTYLGGSSNDSGLDIAVDSENNIYVAGSTSSVDFPLMNSLPPHFNFSSEAFITKLNANGTALIYSTFLGGRDSESSTSMAIDSSGCAYLTGTTRSEDFPTVNPIQAGCAPSLVGSCSDAFVSKLNPTGSMLVYSTYVGGNREDFNMDVAVDDSGNCYVVGQTGSSDFPVANSLQPTYGGGPERVRGDVYVAKINAAGSGFIYSTYLGGYGEDRGVAIALDRSGNAYITGFTRSPNFPTANPLQPVSDQVAFKTINGGLGWSPVDSGLTVADVQTLAIDPNTPSTLYAGTIDGGVFKSIDGGGSWVAINNGQRVNASINDIAVDPTNGNTIYTAGSSVFKSTDGGASWFFRGVGLPFAAPTINCIEIDPSDPSVLYAGTPFNGVFKSTDGGGTWDKKLFDTRINSLAFDPKSTSPTTVFAGASSRVLKSTDGGINWQTFSVPGGNIEVVIVDPSNPSVLYAGGTGILKSTNGGSSWSNISPPTFLSIGGLAIDPSTPSTLYAGGSFGGGLFKTIDGGNSWSAINTGITSSRINELLVDPSSTSVAYAGASVIEEAFVTKISADGSILAYSTYLGGNLQDFGEDITVDSAGNAYLIGFTGSNNLPVVNALQPAFNGSIDAFVAKVNASGSALAFLTYLGGTGNDRGHSIAIDSLGQVYLAGETRSTDFPLVNPIQPAFGGGNFSGGDVFVAKLNSAANAISFSSYLGGSEPESAHSLARDSLGRIYIAGQTLSLNFPVTPGAYQPSLRGPSDAFITRISFFDYCIQDELSGDAFQINISTGEYLFTICSGLPIVGTGTLTTKGNIITLQHNASDRRISVRIDLASKRATASVQLLSQGRSFTLTDKNIANNPCTCARR